MNCVHWHYLVDSLLIPSLKGSLRRVDISGEKIMIFFPGSKSMDLGEYLELGANFLTQAQSNPETFKNEVDLLKSRFWGWYTRSMVTPVDSDLKSIENTIGI